MSLNPPNLTEDTPYHCAAYRPLLHASVAPVTCRQCQIRTKSVMAGTACAGEQLCVDTYVGTTPHTTR